MEFSSLFSTSQSTAVLLSTFEHVVNMSKMEQGEFEDMARVNKIKLYLVLSTHRLFKNKVLFYYNLLSFGF